MSEPLSASSARSGEMGAPYRSVSISLSVLPWVLGAQIAPMTNATLSRPTSIRATTVRPVAASSVGKKKLSSPHAVRTTKNMKPCALARYGVANSSLAHRP